MRPAVILAGGSGTRATRGDTLKAGSSRLIRKRVPSAHIDCSAKGRDHDRRDYAVSYVKIRSLGYEARIGVAQGIEELNRAFLAIRAGYMRSLLWIVGHQWDSMYPTTRSVPLS